MPRLQWREVSSTGGVRLRPLLPRPSASPASGLSRSRRLHRDQLSDLVVCLGSSQRPTIGRPHRFSITSLSVAVSEAGVAAENAAVKAGGGQYADLTPLFCSDER